MLLAKLIIYQHASQSRKRITMDRMQFTIELIDKLIWPAVIVFCIVSLKKPITKLLPLAKKLKYKDFEVEFGQELKQVAKKAEVAFPELKQDKKATLIATAENLPNAAVLQAWQVVDEATEILIKAKNEVIDLTSPTRYKLMEDILINTNIIDTKKGKLFRELRVLRNRVAHADGFEVGKVEAIQYIELCFKLLAHLQELTQETMPNTSTQTLSNKAG